MNIKINNSYNPSLKANYVRNLKTSTIKISGGRKIFLGTKNNQYLEAFITKTTVNGSHGENAIKDYIQTEYKQKGLSVDEIAEFYGKVCQAIGNNTINLGCGAKINTESSDIRIFLKELFKALLG